MRWWGKIAACGPLVACLGVAAAPAPARVGDLTRAFEPEGESRFVHHGASYEARLLGSSLIVTFDGGAAIEIGLGATLPVPAVGGIDPLPGRARDVDTGPRPIFDGIRYDAVRPGVGLEVRALDDGLELTLLAGPGAFAGPISWTLAGAGQDTVEVVVRGGSLVERPDGAREIRFERAGVRSATIRIVPSREGAAPAAEPVRLAVGADGARYLAGRARDYGFVAKLLPDDSTLVWVSRFPLPEGEHVRGVEVLEEGRVLVRGAAMLSAEGSVISLERGVGMDAEAPLSGPSPLGPTSRLDAVVGRVLAGVTSERRLPGATIAVPLESGESAFLAARSAGCPGTINFDNSAGSGLWTTAANWDLDRLPNATDDVCIGPGFAVTLNAGSQSILSLTTDATATLSISSSTTLTIASASTLGGAVSMSGGTWNGAGDVTIGGTFTWTGGALAGGGTTHASGGIVAGGVFKDLNPRTLHNTGTASWTGTGGIRLGGGATIQNDGVWDAQGDATVSAIVGGGTFLNAGTLRKSGGTGTSTIDVPLTSSGSVDVQSGTLNLSSGGSASGGFTGSGGATLRFGGGTMSLGPTSTVSVATARFDGGTIGVAGSYAASVATQVAGGSVTFSSTANVGSVGPALSISSGSATFESGETIAPTTLTLSGGALSGTDTVTVSGLLTWSGGAMTGGGTTTANGGIAMSGTFKDLNPRILQNVATATWSGTGAIRIGGGSRIENTGTWEASNDASMTALVGSGTFVNDGTFRKTGGTGITAISFPFDSAGGVTIQSGSIRFLGGGTGSGTFTGSPGTILRFNGSYTLTAASSVSVDAAEFEGGTVAVNGAYTAATGTTLSGSIVTFGATAQLVSIGSALAISSGSAIFSSGETIAPATLVLSGGTLGGTDLVDVSGAITWTAGSMTGGGTTRASGGLSISGSSFKDLNPRTLRIPAGKSAAWGGTGSLRIGGGGMIQNDGLWDAQSDESIVPLVGSGTFSNAGTLRKSAGTATSSIAVALDSPGAIEIQTATLSLGGGGSVAGAITGSPGTTLRFASGTFTLGAASSVAVPSVGFDGGTINLNGAYAATTATTTAANTTFTATSTVSSVGALTVQGGTVTFSSGETIQPTTMSFTNGTLAGTDTVDVGGLLTWTGGAMSGGGTTRALGGMLLNGSTFCDLNPRTLRNVGTATWSGGILRLGAGAQLINDGLFDAQSDGVITTVVGGGTVVNTGTLRKSGGTGATQLLVPLTSSGTVEALSHTIDFASGFTQTAGTLTLNGGTVVSSAPLSIQGGTFRGVGSTGIGVTSSGTTSPGLSPGLLGVTGAWSQSAAGTLAIELGGVTPGTQHDRLDVSGAATIDGTLSVGFTGGYVPITGDAFTILTAATRTGTFASTILPPLGAGQFWNVNYKPASVELKIVPLPAGRVPQGSLKLGKSGAQLKLDWSAGCVATDIDSEIYEGGIGGTFTSHVPIVCSTGGALTWTLSPAAGNRYYLVVPTNGAGEGSYGFAAPGVERAVSASACHVQAIAPCP